MESTKPKTSKKILCFFESTGNGEIHSNPKWSKEVSKNNWTYTNVMRLYMLAGGSLDLDKFTGVEDSNQICLYCNGVGGDTDTPGLWQDVNFMLGILKFQRESMKCKLEKVYEDGDEIYVIGFSRGSAAARRFVADLDRCGLKTKEGKTVEKPPVAFLGCFDTVSMQVKDIVQVVWDARKGIITPSEQVDEKDGKLPSIVKKAVHNVALDDYRFASEALFKEPPYPPVFMDSTDDRVNEVWFPGVHEDVGGSFLPHGLSDCSGVYMQEWLENEGIVFYEPDKIPADRFEIPKDVKGSDKASPVTGDVIKFNPDPASANHIETTKFPRPVATVHHNEIFEDGTVRIHESVLKHLKQHKEYKINPNLKNVNNKKGKLVVVGSLNQELKEKTEEFLGLLEKMDL